MNKNKKAAEVFKKLSEKYSDPYKVQAFLRTYEYNSEKNGETLSSAFKTFKKKKAHCFEAAFLAAAILEYKGYPPLVLSFESIDNLDHVIYVYKNNNKWGSIGRSRDQGLHGRKAQFRSLRDLVLSYYEPYIDKTGCITGYQVAHLDDTETDWRYGDRNLWKAEQYLIDIKHRSIRFNKKRHSKIKKRYLRGISAKPQRSWL